MRNRLARAVGRLVGCGEFDQKGDVGPLVGGQLAVFGYCPLPIPQGRVQIADACSRFRVMLEQPVERLLITDNVLRRGQFRPGIDEVPCRGSGGRAGRRQIQQQQIGDFVGRRHVARI